MALKLSSQAAFGGVGPAMWLERVFRFSIFAFSSPILEARFHQYCTNTTNMWTAVYCCKLLIGWLMFACKYVSFPAERVHLPRDWPLALTQPLIAAAILGLMLLRPAFYRKHQRGIGVMAVGALPVTPGKSGRAYCG